MMDINTVIAIVVVVIVVAVVLHDKRATKEREEAEIREWQNSPMNPASPNYDPSLANTGDDENEHPQFR